MRNTVRTAGRVAIVWPALALLVATVLAVACGRSDPERELRNAIVAMETAVESRQVSDFVSYVADDFTRESGGFDKQDARRMLAAAMLRNEKIQLAVAIGEVRIDGARATARVRVVATGGSGLLPERGQTWEFDTAWRHEGGRWKVFNAEWREDL